METFVIKVQGDATEVTRGQECEVTFLPKEISSGAPIVKQGIVTGLSLNLAFLLLHDGDSIDSQIPIDEITKIVKIK